ncbi:hypothetical protein VR010_04045 [Actinomycetaceae bacterium L2_0104]
MQANRTPEWAAEQLAHAATATSGLQTASTRRTQLYLGLWALASAALVLCIGLLDKVWVIAAMAAWGAVVLAGVVWSRRWGAIAKGSNAQIRRGAIGWVVVYAIVIACGTGGKIESPWFWMAGATATAVPLLVAARQCTRCNDVRPRYEKETSV